jgi:hypothetical protein
MGPKFRNFWCHHFSFLLLTRRMRLSFSAAALFAATSVFAQQPSTGGLYDQAVLEWQRGAYPAALQKLITVVSAPDGAQYLERTALLTGELFRTKELATDGRAARWSPSGNFASYELGAGRARVTRVLDMKPGGKQIAEVAGYNYAFAPDDRHGAFLASAPAENWRMSGQIGGTPCAVNFPATQPSSAPPAPTRYRGHS